VTRSFADKDTCELYLSGESSRISKQIAKRAIRKLDQLNAARTLADLRVPLGNRLHALHGDRVGQFAIAVNKQWRICFRFHEGEADDVELCDYH
jgi:proteic killer suppression protein